MEFLKVLEDESIHVIIGVKGNEEGVSVATYSILSRLAGKYGVRRFTLHVVSYKPRPQYIEEIRSLIQNNIVYTLVVRYLGFDFEEIRNRINMLKQQNRPVYGIVSGDLEELASLFQSLGVPYERI